MSRITLRAILLGLSISGAAWGQTEGEEPKAPRSEYVAPLPSPYEMHSRPRWGLVIPGAVLAGAGYGFAVVGAIDTKFAHHGGFLLLPLVGPWLTIAAGARDQGERFTIGLDGVVQAAGALMLTLGLALPRKQLEPAATRFSVLPVALGNAGYGAGVVGAF